MLVALTREVHTKAKRETLRFKVEVNTNFVIPKKFSPICKNVLINNLTNVLIQMLEKFQLNKALTFFFNQLHLV